MCYVRPTLKYINDNFLIQCLLNAMPFGLDSYSHLNFVEYPAEFLPIYILVQIF